MTYDQRRRRQEAYVAALRQRHPTHDDALYGLQPDAQFSVLDCRLLALLATKHARDRGPDIQQGFYDATGVMVDVGVLRQISESKSRTGVAGGFSERDYHTLLFVQQKCLDEKLRAMQGDFFDGVSGMVSIDFLKQKLGWSLTRQN